MNPTFNSESFSSKILLINLIIRFTVNLEEIKLSTTVH